MRFLFLSFLGRLRMRGRRGPCRWRCRPRGGSLALLLPVIKFCLLVLLVLGILLHRRSRLYQWMPAFRRGRVRYRTSHSRWRLRWTRWLRRRRSGMRDTRWRCRAIVGWWRRLRVRRLIRGGLRWSSGLICRPGRGLRRSRCLFANIRRSSLPLFKRSRRSWWLFHRDDLPVRYRSRRFKRSRSTCSHHTRARRLCRYGVSDGSAFDLLLIYLDHAGRNRTSIDKGVMIYHRHSIGDVLVRIRDSSYVGGVVIDDSRVVNIRDLSYRNSRVGDVHVVHVAGASSIPRHKDFTRSQWKPSHTNTNSNPESTAHERD